jgi:hypothetical protein
MIDAGEPIRRRFSVDPEAVINRGGVHYTPAANELVADVVAAGLATSGLDPSKNLPSLAATVAQPAAFK